MSGKTRSYQAKQKSYHDYYPVIPGISEPTYTAAELREMNAKENIPTEYCGKTYTKYEALQRQRSLETKMRAQRRQIKLLQEGNAAEDDIINARCRYRGTSQEYSRFSKAMGIPQQRERVTVDGLGNIGVGKYTKTVEKSAESGIIKSGALSGAHNPQSDQAQEHAEKYYKFVRHMKTDIKQISINTGFSEDDIAKVKNHVFIEKHDLGNGKLEYFYPNYEMSQSWQRLIDGKNIQKHDITLLNHELLEQRLMKNGCTQSEAHRIAEKSFNYSKESKAYYANIDKYKKKR